MLILNKDFVIIENHHLGQEDDKGGLTLNTAHLASSINELLKTNPTHIAIRPIREVMDALISRKLRWETGIGKNIDIFLRVIFIIQDLLKDLCERDIQLGLINFPPFDLESSRNFRELIVTTLEADFLATDNQNLVPKYKSISLGVPVFWLDIESGVVKEC